MYELWLNHKKNSTVVSNSREEHGHAPNAKIKDPNISQITDILMIKETNDT